jgi:hypothetical protein
MRSRCKVCEVRCVYVVAFYVIQYIPSFIKTGLRNSEVDGGGGGNGTDKYNRVRMRLL